MISESTLVEPIYELDRLADEVDYAIIGPTDGRSRVTDTRRVPYSAVAHIERDFGDGRLIGCTAFFISPTVLLTAAHCIASPVRRALRLPHAAVRIRVTPGRDGRAVMPFGQQWARVWRAHPVYARHPAPEVDVGLIELAQPFRPHPGHFRLSALGPEQLRLVRARRLAHIAGYPGDKLFGTQWEHAERLDRVTPALLFYSVDTCPGHSGAPVWIRSPEEDAPTVIAVHTAGPRPHAGGAWGCRAGVPVAPAGKFNRGVRITPSLLRWIGSGLTM